MRSASPNRKRDSANTTHLEILEKILVENHALLGKLRAVERHLRQARNTNRGKLITPACFPPSVARRITYPATTRPHTIIRPLKVRRSLPWTPLLIIEISNSTSSLFRSSATGSHPVAQGPGDQEYHGRPDIASSRSIYPWYVPPRARFYSRVSITSRGKHKTCREWGTSSRGTL